MISIQMNTATYLAMQWFEKELTLRKRAAKNNNLPEVKSLIEWDFLDSLPEWEQPEALRLWVLNLGIQFPKHPTFVNEFWSTWLHDRTQELSFPALALMYRGEKDYTEELCKGYTMENGYHCPTSDVFEENLRFFLQNNYDVQTRFLKSGHEAGCTANLLADLRSGRERFIVKNPPGVLMYYMNGWFRDCYTDFVHTLTGEVWVKSPLHRNKKAVEITRQSWREANDRSHR